MTVDQMNIEISKLKGWRVIDVPFVPRDVKPDEMTCFTMAAKEQWYRQYKGSKLVQPVPDWVRSEEKNAELLDDLIKDYTLVEGGYVVSLAARSIDVLFKDIIQAKLTGKYRRMAVAIAWARLKKIKFDYLDVGSV